MRGTEHEQRYERDAASAVAGFKDDIDGLVTGLYARACADALVRQGRPEWVKYLDRHDEAFVGREPEQPGAVWMVLLHDDHRQVAAGGVVMGWWDGCRFMDFDSERLVAWWAVAEPPLGPVLP